MSTRTPESISKQFNTIRWHDSKLLGLSFHRVGSDDEIRLLLELRGSNGDFSASDLIFKGSTYIALEIDLEGKRVCADDISNAMCHTSSEFLVSLGNRNPHDSFEGYLHFSIEMIPPGGAINILATDFVVEAKDSRAEV